MAAIGLALVAAICAVTAFASGLQASGAEMGSHSPKEILHELERLRQFGSVLYIAAHPDDENTELLSYLARGRKYRTAYLSLTRGDGGQNVLGSDLGDKLGVARTHELLAAREIDGAQQFFSRAIDYGFSKNYLETLSVWDKQEVLSDMVRVIRKFRPDVIITRFSPSPGGTHGHHTTATVLAIEAFKLAADPNAFPEQHLNPWQAKRLLWNASVWQKDKITSEPILKVDISGNDPVSGRSFHDVASASRAMHKTQGFDQFVLPGGNGEQRIEQFQLLGGDATTQDVMDGVDTTWARTAGGAAIQSALDSAIAKFDPATPAAVVPDLLEIRASLNKLASAGDSVLKEKQSLLDKIIFDSLDLRCSATIDRPDIVPGERIRINTDITLGAKPPHGLAVKLLSIAFPATKQVQAESATLSPGETHHVAFVDTLPKDTPLTQPYWLRSEGSPGMFKVDDPALIGTPENPPTFPIQFTFDIGGQTLSFDGQPKESLRIIPPVSLHLADDIAIMTPGSSRSVEVEIKGARAGTSGEVMLEAKDGWKVSPEKQQFKLDSVGQTSKYVFTLTAPEHPSTIKLRAQVEVNGVHYSNQYQEIAYTHLPTQVLQPPAVLKAVSVDLQKRGQLVGYLPGAGDSIPSNLQQMGYAVKMLDEASLTPADLQGLDAIVFGVRAFNVRTNIDKAMPAILKYVEDGGTVIVQYNRPDKLKSDKLAPYPISISADRVTDEKAEMTFLDPNHPVLNLPNKLTADDFAGWVQERGLYFPNKWDEHFVPILSCHDAGEPPTKGALLIAGYGKGYYIYTGLSLFRQLPAAVPGAYRLFANMVSLGK